MAREKIRILVADDEPRYVWATKVNLEARGYEVITAMNGEEALALAVTESPDLIILDIRMPDMQGDEVCARIREFSNVPIIMLTALADERNKVRGLDAGADDYVTKPFSAAELLARVRAALRRVELSTRRMSAPVLQYGGLKVDLARKRVSVKGREVSLTPTEYRLLREFVRLPGHVLVPEYLLERVWGVGYEGAYALLRQAIHRLRQKIEPDPRHPRYIRTRRGIGYIFQPEEE